MLSEARSASASSCASSAADSLVAAAPSRGQASSIDESFISISVKMYSSSEWSSSSASSSLSPATPSRHAFSRSAGQIRSSSACSEVRGWGWVGRW